MWHVAWQLGDFVVVVAGWQVGFLLNAIVACLTSLRETSNCAVHTICVTLFLLVKSFGP